MLIWSRSFQTTYEELKRDMGNISGYALKRFQTTYEELKPTS